jgi:hypothetical protein
MPRARSRDTRAFLRRNLPSAAGVGVLMAVIALKEGAGAPVAAVVALVGCGAVLGMLALRR